ncbi:tyrosine-protein phosphatase [Rossellomorea aquimaris]|uniref:tyrosine-protein phosphatase n=1 Tax=Rossellomorea aquimaris TaxID=189382 RepID=UPI003CFB25C3
MVRLPLKNAYNVRELGGYPTSRGQITKHHSFLRADDLVNLDEKDIDYLRSYGVTAIVDLRSTLELNSHPNPFSKIDEVNYINISLMTDEAVSADLTKVMTDKPEQLLPNMYIEMVKGSTEVLKLIFEYFAEQEGCILFHCAAGKDRTGIVAMLLLGLAEVERQDIIANYMLTEVYIKENPFMQQATKHYPEFPVELMYSKPAYIEPVIDYILTTYGSVENYLLYIGISKDILASIKNKLVVGTLQPQ